MLQRAVSSSKPTQLKPNPLHSSPSSRTTTQQTIANAFVKRPANPSSSNDAFGPSHTSTVSYPTLGTTPSLTSSSVSPYSSISRKRSLSQHQQGGLASVFNSQSAFQELVPPAFQSFEEPPKDRMSALHDAVYFDEADFDDDCDLDFDTTEPIIYPSLTAAAATLPTPPPQTDQSSPQSFLPPAAPVHHDDFEGLEFAPRPLVNSRLQLQQHGNDLFGSSQPLPWSSSPAEHFESPKPRAPIQEEEVVKPKRKKARIFPWTVEEQVTKVAKVEIVTTPKTSSSKVGTRKIASGVMPWNDSFSNVEAGRKEARKRNAANQQKRSITTATGDPEDIKRAKKGKEQVAHIFLSEEQKRVVDLVMNSRQSVFFTGSAGTGKSVLLRELILELKRNHKKDSDAVAVTASTGLAACNIGGVTLHSFSGIGLGKESVADLVKKIKKNQKARTRWIRTKILIMDEISMVDGDLFDKLEAIARQIRNNGQPFGGIQLVITGDFFQLPPVPDSGKIATFAFDAKTWNSCIAHTIGLTQVFRQRDPEFARMLNEMRLGKLSKETVDAFRQLSRPIQYDDGIQATELFSTRSEVDTANNQKMRSLPGEVMRFQAMDTGSVTDPKFRAKLLGNCMAPMSIELKIHSQVMLIKNVDDTLVNGSLGRVVGFMSAKTFDIMTEDGEIDIASKQKKLPGAVDTSQLWPLVQFALMDGTSRQLLCQPEQWKIELPNGEVQAARNQVPLILAWALSIHKAQGQTLERVKVDLRRAFEKGQAYVALSRATCKEGLQVLGFEEKKVMAHERVRTFYDSLSSAAEAAKRIESTKSRRS